MYFKGRVDLERVVMSGIDLICICERENQRYLMLLCQRTDHRGGAGKEGANDYVSLMCVYKIQKGVMNRIGIHVRGLKMKMYLFPTIGGVELFSRMGESVVEISRDGESWIIRCKNRKQHPNLIHNPFRSWRVGKASLGGV